MAAPPHGFRPPEAPRTCSKDGPAATDVGLTGSGTDVGLGECESHSLSDRGSAANEAFHGAILDDSGNCHLAS